MHLAAANNLKNNIDFWKASATHAAVTQFIKSYYTVQCF